jgi:hypothetical protein
MAEGWRRPHNDEIHNLYTSPNIIRVFQLKENGMGSTCSTHGREGVGKPEGKIQLGRRKRRWEDNIRRDLR